MNRLINLTLADSQEILERGINTLSLVRATWSISSPFNFIGE